MSYYETHIFMCTNQKAPGKTCCAQSGGEEYFDHMKSRLLELGLHGPGKIRLSRSGCLGRCSSGPCIVIYPENIWYTYSSFEDLDQIIESYLLKKQPVKSLLIDQGA